MYLRERDEHPKKYCSRCLGEHKCFHRNKSPAIGLIDGPTGAKNCSTPSIQIPYKTRSKSLMIWISPALEAALALLALPALAFTATAYRLRAYANNVRAIDYKVHEPIGRERGSRSSSRRQKKAMSDEDVVGALRV